MKFLGKALILLVVLALFFQSAESRRIRRRRTQSVEWIKAAFQGFLSGISGASGEDINACLPKAAQGAYLAKDVNEPEEESKKSTSLLEFIWQKLKFVLDLACGFKDGLMELFGLSRRRRHRRHRRVFMSRKRMHGLFDWVSDAWDWVKGKIMSFADWCSKQWDNLKKWTADKWNKLKSWTKDLWKKLCAGVEGAVAKAKELKNKVVSWVINKALPILSLIFKCAQILLDLISKVIGIIKAIANIVAGNVFKLVDMAINVICAYQTVIDLWGLIKQSYETSGNMRGYYIGKFVGTLLDFLASICSFDAKDKRTPEDATKEIKEGLKDNKSSSVVDFIDSLEKKGETVDGWKDKAEKAGKLVDAGLEASKKGLGLKAGKDNIRQIAVKLGGKCLNFQNEVWGNSDRDVETRDCDDSDDNQWNIQDDGGHFNITNMDKQNWGIGCRGSQVMFYEDFKAGQPEYQFDFVTHEFGTRFAQIKSVKCGTCMSTKGDKGDAEFFWVKCDTSDHTQFFQFMNPKADN